MIQNEFLCREIWVLNGYKNKDTLFVMWFRFVLLISVLLDVSITVVQLGESVSGSAFVSGNGSSTRSRVSQKPRVNLHESTKHLQYVSPSANTSSKLVNNIFYRTDKYFGRI